VNDISRLAIIDRGEPVVRVLAAVGNLNRRGDVPSITSIVVTEQSSERAWFAREADELITPPPSPDEVDLSTHIEPGQVVAQVLGAKADTAWIGHTPCLDRAELVAQLEAAGVRVVGPTAQTIRDLADPARLAALGRESGLSPVPDHLTPADWRRIEIDVLADSAGTVWTLGLRDASIRRGPTPVLAEMPAPGVSDTTAGAMSHAVRRLVRAAAYRGAGVVELALAHDGESFWLVGVDTLARTEHALVEEITGASFIGLRLRLAAGDALPATPPTPNGHAVEVRLLAHDPGREYAASGGALEMLSLPVGTGVRVDSSIREGDLVDGRVEPLIATVTAWGRDREEALDRAHGALERTTVVLEIGMTNRTADLAVLERVAAAEQPFDAGWYDRTLAAGGFTSVADPLAVVAAAVEAYESDSTMVNAAFFASAARGRPERPERVGSLVQLSYRGHDYRLRVDRTGPRSYRVRGNATVDLIVDRLGDFERRIICNGHKHRLVAVEQGADFRLDLDGVGHTVSREDGVVVRTGWPALVSSLLVEPGQDVSAGQPVAVLESMKMVTTVTAPFDGTVTSLAVSNNTQIERGAPLMRIKAASHQHLDLGPGDGVGAEPESAVDFSALVTSDGNPEGKDATWVHAHLGDYLLGYDLDPESFKGLLKRQATLGATLPANDPELVGAENALLDLFSDLGALYRPRTEAENPDQMADDNTQEYFLSYLQWLDADQAGLPERYRKRLGAALARYGVAGLSRTKALEAATVWLYRAFARIPEIAPAIVAILNRRLTHHDELADMATLDARARLDRLVRATEGRQQNVSDLARDIIFHFFEEPEMLAATAQMQDQVRADLAALRDLPSGPDREARIEALVAAPHPVRTDLLDAWLQTDADAAGTAYRDVVLEVYARRFYRIRDLQDFGTRSVGAFRIAHADYEHAGMPVRLVNSYLPLEQLPPFADALRGYLCDVPAGREVVVDLVVWQNGKLPDADALVEQVHGIIEHCDFGHALHRLDLTVTGQVGDSSGRSTAHMTFRQGADGAFTEDRLYRNLHPMLAKRLDLWRLSNFTLERLPSTEDVYLFFGVAHENPKDRRLFAVAEVRDLVAVRDDQTGAQTYPRLGRIGLQALAAMRTALSHYPPRERPTANRLVLNVRPVWEIPADEWPALAANYLPLAKGAGLEKVVMHLRTPVPAEDGGTTLVEKVMTIDGIGRTGTTIRFGDPGANPIRPLTRYAQKVLTAERFGTPYPYEIIHMLTPAEGEPSPFPRGHFQELDLDADGETLIPVDRPPAGQHRTPGRGLADDLHRPGARGHDPGGDAVRPDAGPGQPRRARVPPDQRLARARGRAQDPRRVVCLLVRRPHRDGLGHREHGLHRAHAATDHRVHPGRSRDQHRRHRDQRRRPALLERRSDDAHAHQGHPHHDPGQHDGPHRQAGPGLLRGGLGRGQLRYRWLRPGHGAQRPGPVLGAEFPGRLPSAAGALQLHLCRARGAFPAARPDERPGRAGRPRVRARAGAGHPLHDGRRGLRLRDQPRPQAALRHALGHARGVRHRLRAVGAVEALAGRRELHRLGRGRGRHTGLHDRSVLPFAAA
jgi:acetyl/propionyl-CoA carboxylase alpha subunit